MARTLAFLGALALMLSASNTTFAQFVPKIGSGVKIGPVIPNVGGVGSVGGVPTMTFPQAPRLGTTLPDIDMPRLHLPATATPARAVQRRSHREDRTPSTYTPPVTRSVQPSTTKTTDTYFTSQDTPRTGGGGEPPEGGDGDGDEGEDDEEDDDEEDDHEEDSEQTDEDDEQQEATKWWPWLAGLGGILVVGFWFFR